MLFALFVWQGSFAQFYGWPAPSGPLDPAHDLVGGVSEFTVASNTTAYADNNRVRVTGATSLGGSNYQLTIESPTGVNLFTVDFPVDKWCFMVQMEDNAAIATYKVGFNTRIEVMGFTPITASSGTMDVSIPTTTPAITNLPTTFDFSANSRVQLIRVPVYRKLILQPKGELTCHPYNHADGTGGVLPFVANLVQFNGGVINASGKGYHVGYYTHANGTASAAASPPGTAGSPMGWPAGPYPYAANPPHSFGSTPPIDLDNSKRGYPCGSGITTATDFNLLDAHLGKAVEQPIMCQCLPILLQPLSNFTRALLVPVLPGTQCVWEMQAYQALPAAPAVAVVAKGVLAVLALCRIFRLLAHPAIMDTPAVAQVAMLEVAVS